MTTNAQRARPRIEAVAVVTEAAWPGSETLVQGILAESVGALAWRPHRAAVIAGTESRCWMTPAEFGTWITEQTWAWRRRAKDGPPEPRPLPAVGINATHSSSNRKLHLLRGTRAVSKIEALAMAHYAHRFPLPFDVGDVAAFADWFPPRFALAGGIAEWLEYRAVDLTDRLRGFDVRDGQRWARAPEAGLIRALDWVWRVGPFCPYGEPQGRAVWPGQEV